MKLGDLMMQLDNVQHQTSVYDELIAHLDTVLEGGIDIPSPTESGVVPSDAVTLVRNELLARKAQLEQMLISVEDVEVGDVRLETLGGGHPSS